MVIRTTKAREPRFPERDATNDARFASGSRVFALMFSRWMDGNGWSHPRLVEIAEGAMGSRWLHSSSISALRHNNVDGPNPRQFQVIATLNQALYDWQTEGKRIPGCREDDYSDPVIILEDGKPPSTGWFVEVFLGLREPKEFKLNGSIKDEADAEAFCQRFAKRMRKELTNQGLDIFEGLDHFVREHYPVRDTQRVEAVRQLIGRNEVMEHDTLVIELPLLTQMYQSATEETLDENALVHTFLRSNW